MTYRWLPLGVPRLYIGGIISIDLRAYAFYKRLYSPAMPRRGRAPILGLDVTAKDLAGFHDFFERAWGFPV